MCTSIPSGQGTFLRRMEEEMLEFVAAERRPTSRLACQLVLPPECDGLRVFMPEMQS
jgi:ferredoxin, 2Fe-2S